MYIQQFELPKKESFFSETLDFPAIFAAFMAQVKCPSCSKWVESAPECSSCGSVLDRNELLKQEREKSDKRPKHEIKTPGWLERFFERTEHSNNPFMMLLRFTIQAVWFVYLSLLAFVIWFVTALVG